MASEEDPPYRLSDLGPCKLSWSTPSWSSSSSSSWGLAQMWVFWSTYNDELQRVNPQLRATVDIFIGDTVTKEKIKYILEDPRASYWGKYLVQFWGLVKIGDKMYLTTCDQPFALSYFNGKGTEGLCEYRKKCLNYLIPVATNFQEEEPFGPPGRVFYSGLPEYVKDIQHYSPTEYPLYDCAVNRVEGYWALPVRIAPANSPIGVLEIVSPSFVNYLHFEKVIKVLIGILPLYDIGLCEEDGYDLVSRSFFLRPNSCQKREIARINEVLEVVCKAHRLTLAQTWMLNSVKALIAVGMESYIKKLTAFTDASRACFWSEGQGVVGKAFSSKSACYCRDVKQLSIKEYPLVHNAREDGLSGCFAVCLQSSSSNNCYTLEFFLPSNETNNGDPRTLLRRLMLTLKGRLRRSFKIASGQELGQKLFVEVIKVSSDDTLDFFEITSGRKSAFGAAEVHSRGGMMPPDSSAQQVNAVNNSINGVHEQKIGIVGSRPSPKPVQNIVSITYQEPNAELDAANQAIDGVSLEQRSNDAAALRNQGSSYTLDRDGVSLEQSGRKQGSSYIFNRDDGVSLEQSGRQQVSSYTLDRDDGVSLEQRGNDVTALRKQESSNTLGTNDGVSLEQSGNDATALRKRGPSYTLKSERGISREILEQNSTMKIGDAAKHLGVGRSTLKRICREYDIHRWPPHKARKNNQAFVQEKVAQSFVENNEGQSRSDTTRQQEHGGITVKATYGDDIIKFQLPFSARKMDLEEKVAQRLNLLVGSFKIKYLDADGDRVLVTCDEDLSTTLSTLRSLGRTTLKMWIIELQTS